MLRAQSVGIGTVVAKPAMGKAKGGLRALPSKTTSCSELAEGHKKLLKVKKEHEPADELQSKIQDWIWGDMF